MAELRQIEGFILAGGESSRMGREKALLDIGGEKLIKRMAQLVESVAGGATVVGASANIRALGLPSIADDWPGAGPLGGIATALGVSGAPWSLVVACDLPYLTKAWLQHLADRALGCEADAVCAMNTRGVEPLAAMYHQRAEAVIRSALTQGTRKVTDALEKLTVEVIEPAEWKPFDSDGYLFKNMNSPEDYEEARARLGRGADTR
jgi:molybdopterin-guanine dinucleotide biosynthesis protein A